MKKLVTTTAYFPPLDWFTAANSAEAWEWEAHENYQKGGWRNRCRIAGANGPLLLSVPLVGGKHQQMPIREVRISYRNDWWRAHEQTIRSAYGRAPYFEHFAEEIFLVARKRPETLWELNLTLTERLSELLHLPYRPVETKEFTGGVAGAAPVPGATSPYPQVFTDRHGFMPGLSVLDGIFCLGPEVGALSTVDGTSFRP